MISNGRVESGREPSRPRPGARPSRTSLVLIGCLALALASVAPAAAPPGRGAKATCSKYASASAGDGGRGTLKRPFRTAQRLVANLAPGQTGCLLGGTFVGNVRFPHGGAPGAPITLRTAPGYGRATIRGVVYQPQSSPWVTIDGIYVDARDASESVAVQLIGDYGRLTNSEVYGGFQPRIGVGVGYYGAVRGVEIDRNRIHGFGAGSDKEHGIYVVTADGVRVHDNLIYDNSGYGIHLWTHSLNGHFYNNTIDGNGAGNIMIGGQWNSYGEPSSNNVFYGNILSNPRSGRNVRMFWSAEGAGTPGEDNRVFGNCVWGGGLVQGPGVTYSDNKIAPPLFASRAGENFTLLRGSPCASFGARLNGPS